MDKYKVLIADDEEIIRSGLKSLVETDEDFMVVAMAEDGEVALNLAREYKPDLILADINMPFMNGLDFVEELLKDLPGVTVVIVTGYDDFTYVRKALQLGAKDYILKPIMEEPFYELLNKMKRVIASKFESSKYIKWAKGQIEKNRLALIEKFMNEWIYTNPDEIEVREKMQYLGINLPENFMLTLISMKESVDSKLSEELLNFAAKNIAEEVIEPAILSFTSSKGVVAVLSADIDDEAINLISDKLKETFERILNVRAEIVWGRGESFYEMSEVFLNLESNLRERSEYSTIVKESVALIEREYMEKELSLQRASDYLHISPQYLSRLFKAETGETFGSFLADFRAKKAIILLKDQELKIYEIAERCGYATQHYFSNAFKKETGMSPMDYRAQICD